MPAVLQIIEHPLVQHKLSLLRRKTTSSKGFRALINEMTLLLGYEATKHLQLEKAIVQTPLEETEARILTGKKPVVLPILRAGIGMLEAFLALMPSARVGHIGLYRDEKTLQPHCYYFKIPENSHEREYFVCDPMLATGGSAVATIDRLKEAGVQKINFICIVAAPQGVQRLQQAHPEVTIYTASVDRDLDSASYIVPGLGDAGDRLFGTQ